MTTDSFTDVCRTPPPVPRPKPPPKPDPEAEKAALKKAAVEKLMRTDPAFRKLSLANAYRDKHFVKILMRELPFDPPPPPQYDSFSTILEGKKK